MTTLPLPPVDEEAQGSVGVAYQRDQMAMHFEPELDYVIDCAEHVCWVRSTKDQGIQTVAFAYGDRRVAPDGVTLHDGSYCHISRQDRKRYTDREAEAGNTPCYRGTTRMLAEPHHSIEAYTMPSKGRAHSSLRTMDRWRKRSRPG